MNMLFRFWLSGADRPSLVGSIEGQALNVVVAGSSVFVIFEYELY
jgi:hypothetical protein